MSASADSVAPEDCLPRQLPEILGDLADRTGDGDSSASITADSSGLQHELCGSFGWLQFFFGRKDKGLEGGEPSERCGKAHKRESRLHCSGCNPILFLTK